MSDADFFPKCRIQDCEARAVDDKEFCRNHICEFRGCGGQRSHCGTLCGVHKCGVVTCPHPRCNMSLPPVMIMMGNQWPLSPYCNGHACHHDSCTQQSAERSRYCSAHTPCLHPGCTNMVQLTGTDPTCCSDHNQRDSVGRRRFAEYPGVGGGWPGGWGVNAVL